jgi:hypothetical protein
MLPLCLLCAIVLAHHSARAAVAVCRRSGLEIGDRFDHVGLVVVEEALLGGSEGLFDLLGGLLLGDAVLLSNLVNQTILVALDGGEVFGGELVELGAEGVADVLHSVGHVD